jgi:hypothetical protein
MRQIQQMFQSHPARFNFKSEEFAASVQACAICTEVCASCADACLAEADVKKLVSCIRTNLDCADLCGTVVQVLCRQTEPKTEFVHALLQAVVQGVRDCADECEQHATHHEHCRICALACRSCEERCQRLLDGFEAMAA